MTHDSRQSLCKKTKSAQCRNPSFHFLFQIIVLGAWVFAAFLNIPLFLARTFDKEKSSKNCVQSWPEKWMSTTYCLACLVLVVVSVGIMVVLYSTVVYTLWFKRNENKRINYQQKVSV